VSHTPRDWYEQPNGQPNGEIKLFDGDLEDLETRVAAYADTVATGLGGVFDVTAYGATGDGSTDDHAAITSAFEAASAGDTVFFPGGTYIVSDIVEFPDGVVVQGSSRDRSIIRMQNSANKDAVAAASVWLSTSKTSVDQPTSIRHLMFDANKANQASGAGHGLVVMSYWTSVMDCGFQNTRGDGLRITNTRRDATEIAGTMVETFVWRCHTRSTDQYGIHVYDVTPSSGAVNDGWVLDCVVGGATLHGIYIETSAGWEVRGCHLYTTERSAIHVERASAVKIIGNYMESWGYSSTAGGYAAVSLGPYVTFYYPSVVANNIGFNNNGTWNASSTLYGVRGEVANSATAHLSVVGNAFYLQTAHTNSRGIHLGCQGATALMYASVSGNLTRGFTIPISCDRNSGTLEVRGDLEEFGQSVAYAANITPDPYRGGRIVVGTLTGGITVAAPASFHQGARLSFIFTQDGTGGHAVTWNAAFKVNWTPDTAASKKNTITFEYDGTNWVQVASATGL
jgi:hypothetical protein